MLPKPPIKEIHFYGYIPLFVGLYVTSISIMMVGLLHWNLCAPPKNTGACVEVSTQLILVEPSHWSNIVCLLVVIKYMGINMIMVVYSIVFCEGVDPTSSSWDMVVCSEQHKRVSPWTCILLYIGQD